MTRRGSLVYYLAAWTVGTFSMSLLVWIRSMTAETASVASTHSAFGLLFFAFYGLIFGAAAAFLGAFLLRRIMAALRSKNPIHWAAVGTVLAPILIAALGALRGRTAAPSALHGPRFLAFATFGPEQVLEAGWWLAIPAGAATAYLLGRIERAFAPAKATS